MTSSIAVFLVGWMLGWLMLWRLRPLPMASDRTEPVAVIVPARNEANALSNLLPALIGQLRPGDELVVVDDHSTDATASIAETSGARIITAPAPPAGWLGKPNACWAGQLATTAEMLVFIDADVRPAADLLDRLATAVALTPTSVVSVQPWHATQRWHEQPSLLFNVVSLMGTGAFTPVGQRAATTMAFGPVLALRRSAYIDAGGHAAESVRSSVVEDIELAKLVGQSRICSGYPDTTFRMHPAGWSEMVRGWTRSMAPGLRATSPRHAVAIMAWISSVAGGWLAWPWAYPLTAFQLWLLGRRAGRFHPLTSLFYPLTTVVFVAIVGRSVWVSALRRPVGWKDRRVATR